VNYIIFCSCYHSWYQKCIHLHALSLLGILDYKYLNTIKCALSEEEAEAYEQNLPNCPMVTPTQFMLDCSHNRDTPFNQSVITVFAEDFLDKVENYFWYSSAKIPQWYHNIDTIEAAFKAHFSYIKTHYREVMVAPSKDPIQAKQAINLKLQSSSHGSRKARVCTQWFHISVILLAFSC